MALDRKQIALSVVGIVAGFALTYILWKRSQQADAATAANAAAQAAAQEQDAQQLDYASEGLSSAGSSGGTIYESSPTTTSSTTGATNDDSTNDITSLVSAILDDANGVQASIPGNSLIPEVQVSDGTSSLSGIDTSAAAILGTAPASTVTSTTSTGQTYGATTSDTAGGDSNPPASGVTPILTPIGGGGDPITTRTSLQVT